MNITGLLSKRSVVLTVIEHVELQSVKVVYVKATTRRLTTSEATELGVLRTYQLALLVAQQIGVGNLSVLNKLSKLF